MSGDFGAIFRVSFWAFLTLVGTVFLSLVLCLCFAEERRSCWWFWSGMFLVGLVWLIRDEFVARRDGK